MLDFPGKEVSTNGIKGIAHEVIDPFLVGECAMSGIVHNVKANSGDGNSHEEKGDEFGQKRKVGPNHNCIAGPIEGNEEESFEVKGKISFGIQLIIFEIAIYPTFKFGVEIGFLGRLKCYFV